ncbi:diacylglycerol kinase family protein [Sulfobacillus thermotolerans]|uniref:diacylglycerol kinase family protein n=1 Tax=Sulfobacillus thermotolerans TaxID=338644 RepID=UPI0033695AAE
MTTIGLIINPMAGRDIRRLVAAASLQSAPEKMLTARRLLSGMAAVPDTEVVMVNDYEGFGRYALHELGELLPVRLVAAEKEPSNGASTTDWARRLQDEGARVVVSVGGDGTQRNVAQAGLRRPEDVEQLFLSMADPVRPGLSNVGGFFQPIYADDDVALHLTLGDETMGQRPVLAVMAPGLVVPFYVKASATVDLNSPVVWSRPQGGSVALDGERTVVLRPDEPVSLRVERDGPFVLDPQKILAAPTQF